MKPIKCPVCDGEMAASDLPANYRIYSCRECKEVGQVLGDGTVSPMGPLLERSLLGDDRVRAAMSTPHVADVKSFLEIFDGAERQRELAMAQAKGGLRQVLAQVENRIDVAISKLSGMDLVFDGAGDALAALREAREFVSPGSARTRGVAPKEATSAGSSE